MCSVPFIVRVRFPMSSLSVTFPSRYQYPFTYISWVYCLAAVTVPLPFFCTTLSPLITGLSASNITLLSAPALRLPSPSLAITRSVEVFVLVFVGSSSLLFVAVLRFLLISIFHDTPLEDVRAA